MLAIGEFSRITHLSVRTLRRYHEVELLEPELVDASSGYRYYAVDQIPTAQVIHRLRELDVPLSDVQRILRSPDPDQRASLVAEHLGRLESELARTRAAVVSLRRLLAPEPAPLRVELRAEPAVWVAAVEDVVGEDDVVGWYAGAMAELDAVLGPAPAVEPPGGLYDNALFERGRGRMLLYRPSSEPPTRGRVHPVRLPPAELAVTTHEGARRHRRDLRRARLLGRQERPDSGRTGTGALPRESARHRRQCRWRTEIGWPVFHVARNP